MPYVYSTLTCDNEYRTYTKGGGDMPSVSGKVLIKGGAGVANSNIITPMGVATDVTADELKMLEENDQFKLHVKNGFIVVDKGAGRKKDVEDVVKDMAKKDRSAPITPKDYADDKKPIVNKG